MTGAATLAGFACGLRTFSGPLVLARRAPVRAFLAFAAAGELVGDKLPSVPSRTAPGPLALRVAAGAFCGHVFAGRAGLVAGAAGAAAGSFAGQRARGLLTERTGRPDAVFAVAEDTVAYALAAAVA